MEKLEGKEIFETDVRISEELDNIEKGEMSEEIKKYREARKQVKNML